MQSVGKLVVEPFWYVPAGHALQKLDPPRLWYVPDVQFWQVADEFMPVALWNWPALQFMHADDVWAVVVA